VTGLHTAPHPSPSRPASQAGQAVIAGWVRLPLLLGLILPLPARATEPSGVERFLARSEAALNEIAAMDPAAARAACRAFAEAGFDLPAVARAIAEPPLWQRLDEARRASLQAALQARMAADCARRRQAGQLTLLATRPLPDGRTVATRLRLPDGSERLLVWRLHAGGPWGWHATDLTADGVSLAGMLRDDLRSALEDHADDSDAAIASLARGRPPR
jgi:hypothetical protein